MRALILTEGGKKIGFGHLTRCLALSQAIKEAGFQTEFIIYGDKSAEEFLKAQNASTLNLNWHKQDRNILEMVKENDLAIVDSYLAEKSLYDKISKILQSRLLIIDDFNRIEYPKGIVVNPSIYGNELNYPEKDRTVYLLGKDYIILRKEFWKASKKAINKKATNILVTFGAAGSYRLAHRIIKSLQNKFNFDFHLVEPQKNNFNAKRMLALMLKADICISGGGQTTYELAKVGVPTIGICFAENQGLNLEAWHQKGFVEYVGWHNDAHLLDKIIATINRFMPRKERWRRNQIGRSYADGRGVKRIVRTLLKK